MPRPCAPFLLTAAAACALTLSGCGSGDDAAVDTGTSTAGTSAVVATTPTTPAIGTPPGTFRVKEWVEIPFSGDAVGVATTEPVLVAVRVTKIRRGEPSDLPVSPARTETPYYVGVSFKNLSGQDFAPMRLADAFSTTQRSGGRAGRIGFPEPFPTCQQDRPAEFAAGSRFNTCTVFLVEEGDEMTAFQHRSVSGATWTWPVE